MSDLGDEWFRQRLRAVIDRIIPADRDPGALDLGTDGYVLPQLATGAARLTRAIAAGLDALEGSATRDFGVPFATLNGAARDGLLAAIEDEAWFIGLCELTAEGFYADPANGGNRDALSWQMIGYEHRLPDGPSGRLAPTADAGRVPE